MGTYKYIAFISYKREDEKWAKWLHHTLEHYRLPLELRKQDVTLPKEIRPVFLDATDLSAGILSQEINGAITQSKFLIVICSPAAVRSEWVNREIQSFINTGRTSSIIPFIIDGIPKSNEEATECFPKALLELSAEKEILGINKNDIGKDRAAIKVIAQMLDVKFDTLWQRHEREKRKRKRIRAALLSGIVFLSVAISVIIGRLYWKSAANESRFIAERVVSIADAESYTAKKLALEALPTSLRFPNRPYVPEAEKALRYACDVENATLLKDNLEGSIKDICYSTDGKTILAGSTYGVIRYFNADNGALIDTINYNHHSGIDNHTILDDGSIIGISAGKLFDERRFWVHDADRNLAGEGESLAEISEIKLYRDKCIACGLEDGRIQVFDLSNNLKPTSRLCLSQSFNNGYSEHIPEKIDWSSDGRMIAVSYSHRREDDTYIYFDHSTCVWDAQTGSFLCEHKGSWDVYFLPGDRTIAAFTDNGVTLFDAKTGDNSDSYGLYVSDKDLRYFACNKQGGFLAVASRKSIEVIDYINNSIIATIDVKTLPSDYEQPLIECIAISPSGDKVVAGLEGGKIRLYSIRSQDVSVVENVLQADDILYFSNNVLTIRRNYDICSWNYKTGEEVNDSKLCDLLASIKREQPDDYDDYDDMYSITPNGDKLIHVAITKDFQPFAQVYDLTTGLKYQTDSLSNSLTIYPKNVDYDNHLKRAALYSRNSVLVWDLEKGETLKTAYFSGGLIDTGTFGIAMSPDGNEIALVTDREISLWNLGTLEKKDSLSLPSYYFSCQSISFSNNGKMLAAGSYDGEIVLFDLPSKTHGGIRIKQRLIGQFDKSADCILFSPDDSRLFSASDDGQVIMWDTQTGVVLDAKGKYGRIKSLTHSLSDDDLAINAEWGIYVWHYSLQDLIDDTRKRFEQSPLTKEERKTYYID